MAEGFLKAFDDGLHVFSAGTCPSDKVHPLAVQVMQELGVDISDNYPKPVSEFLDQSFDYVITVCGGAKESCPAFTGKVKHRLHIGFEDPAEARGTNEEILTQFKTIRDQILRDFFAFYQTKVSNNCKIDSDR